MKKRSALLILALILVAAVLCGCAPANETAGSEPMATVNADNAEMILTSDAAIAIALSNEGITADQAENLVVIYEIDEGVKEYEIDFRSGDYAYELTVNAETGKITSRDKEHDPVETAPPATEPPATEPPATEPPATEAPKTSSSGGNSSSGNSSSSSSSKNNSSSSSKNNSSSSSSSSGLIGKSKAKSIALNHAGVKSSNATNMRCEYEIDDGRKEYEVDFRSGDYEYDYTINAETGKIISSDKEYDPVKFSSSNKETEPKETKPKETEPKETKPKETEPKETKPKDEVIGKSKAKSIALNHAGVSSSDAKGMECEYDVDDGRKVYEVSFRSGKYEYDYEIDAVTGKILSWDKEVDD